MLTKIQSPSRRTFLQGSLGALFLAVGANGVVWAADIKKYGADAMPGGPVDDPLVFVSIEAEGAVTIVAHRAAMGHGVRPTLPMAFPDETADHWGGLKSVVLGK